MDFKILSLRNDIKRAHDDCEWMGSVGAHNTYPNANEFMTEYRRRARVLNETWRAYDTHVMSRSCLVPGLGVGEV